LTTASPAVLRFAARRRHGAIGDRIANRDDRTLRAAAGDLDIGEIPPAADAIGCDQRRRRALVAAHDEGRRTGAGMTGVTCRRLGQEEADREILAGVRRQRQRVRIDLRAGRDGDRGRAGEGERGIAGDLRLARHAARQSRRADA
jgi:hypothetical protein